MKCQYILRQRHTAYLKNAMYFSVDWSTGLQPIDFSLHIYRVGQKNWTVFWKLETPVYVDIE